MLPGSQAKIGRLIQEMQRTFHFKKIVSALISQMYEATSNPRP